MRKYFLLVALVMATTFSIAQTSSGPGTLDYNGVKYLCDKIEFNVPPDEAENVILDKMKSMGYTPERKSLVFRNVVSNLLDPNQAYDLIFDVSRKSKKESDKSIVSLISAKAGEIPAGKVKRGEPVPTISNSVNAPAFLASFNSSMVQKAFDLDVMSMTKELEKSQKSLDNLVKDQGKIEKKIQDYQADLKKNQKDQDDLRAMIDNQKKQLADKKANAPNQ